MCDLAVGTCPRAGETCTEIENGLAICQPPVSEPGETNGGGGKGGCSCSGSGASTPFALALVALRALRRRRARLNGVL